MTQPAVSRLARHLTLGSLLEHVVKSHDGYDLVAHWKQGEFHHDVIVRVHQPGSLPAPVLVVATNCNGGVKELLLFEEVPERYALWHARCPENPEFEGTLAEPRAQIRTIHWFDPCVLLGPDARSELKPECRRRQRGGGYEPLL